MDPTKQDIYFESMMDYAHHAQTVRYFQVAAFSIVMYDWLMMMRTEIEYVWMKEWTLGTAIMSHPINCHAYFWVVAVSSVLLLFTVQLTLQFRVHALYHCNRRLLYINIAFYSLSIIATCILLAFLGPNIYAFPAPKPFTGCWGEVPRYIFVVWMPGLCFEMWLCALVVRRAYEQSRSDRFIGRHRNILSLLILDSVIWFGVIFILMLWISLGLSFAPRGYNIIGLSYYHTGVNVGGSRLILHMRRAYFNSQMKPVDRSAGVLGFALPFQPPTHSNSLPSANRTPSYIQDAFSVGSDEYENMEEVEMGETLSRFVPARDMRIDVNVQVEVEVRVTNAETLSHLGLP